jgi:multidrug efflux pump
MFTDRFISRPVLAIALNILLLVAGLAALASLQIRQFPRMQFTVITVTTVYTGASADLVQGFVTQPMQEQIAAADGVDYLTSESRSGQSTITVYMRLDYDPSAAQSNILAKIQAVRSDLPDDIEDPKLDISTGDVTQLIYFTLSSDQLDSAQITDYAKRVIQPKFSTVQGVSKIKYYGDREFAMRIWLDPRKLAVYQISAAEVRQAIANNNYQTTAGQVRGQYNTFDIDAHTDLENPEDYGAIIVSSGQKGIIRLRDVADISLGAKEIDVLFKLRGQSAVGIGIDGTPQSNPLEVAKGLKALIPEIERNLPSSLKMEVAYDSTIFIDESIKEVLHTIVEAAVIVTVVIFLFIGSLRSIFVPIIALPLSIVGVAICLAALGFSINLLTLLAIVLAIGLVVDDAIVVLENVDRHMKTGKSPFLASIAGTHFHDHHAWRRLRADRLHARHIRRAVQRVCPDPGRRSVHFRLRGADPLTGHVRHDPEVLRQAEPRAALHRAQSGAHGEGLSRLAGPRAGAPDLGHAGGGAGLRQPLSAVHADQE